MSCIILATEKEFHKAEKVFRRTDRIICAAENEEELAKTILQHGARAIIIGVGRYTGPVYEALGQTGDVGGAVIARFGVGHENVDKERARQHRILVCNTPGALDVSVGEHTLWLLGNLARGIPKVEARLRAGSFTAEAGGELNGKRLGILGFGRIGRCVARAASFGFGMRVWAAGRLNVEALEQLEGCAMAEMCGRYGLERYTADSEDLFRECDFITIHLPAIASTRHFINAERLSLMRPHAALVNTARGSIVDEGALYDALVRGRLAGAALDVFENEPYQPAAPGKDLRTLPNVVLTPHIGSNTREANCRMAEACLANIKHFFDGEVHLMTPVDAQP